MSGPSAISRDGSKLSESDGWCVRAETEAASGGPHGDGPDGPELQEEDDQEYRRYEQNRLSRRRPGREGIAGILAAFHMLRRDIMLDAVGDDPKLGNQQQQRREAE